MRVATEPFFQRSVLIDTIVDTAVKAAADIVNRYYGENDVIRDFIIVGYDISYQQQTGKKSRGRKSG